MHYYQPRRISVECPECRRRHEINRDEYGRIEAHLCADCGLAAAIQEHEERREQPAWVK